jgi:hypothetical protein
MFRTGDVVEAQVTFMAIPLKEQKRKMLPVLRSLALIKGEVGKEKVGKTTRCLSLLTYRIRNRKVNK